MEANRESGQHTKHHLKCSHMSSCLHCTVCLFLSLCVVLPLSMSMAVEVPFIPKQILVYGGNGFIGSSTVEELIPAGHKITLVNRGNWYWDSYFTVRPYVQHIKCDRMQEADKCSELVEYISSVEKIDAVIDFSAYHPESVIHALDLLKWKTKLYIYISTDSVYEVCQKNHTEPSREIDAVRPVSEEKQSEFASQESYGHRKLQCEEVLMSYREEKGGPPFISLRLPDVVGPRDNTYRWWIYQMWLKLSPYLEKEVVIPASLVSQPMSLVYVKDIANLIFQLIHSPQPESLDQAYNLALRETPSLKKLLEDIKAELNLTNVNISTSTKPDTVRLFPSVYLGPIDISKAEKILIWNPTDWKTVLKETTKFYENALRTVYFDRARKDVIRTMQTYFTSKPYNVIRGLRDIYGLAMAEPRDEL